MPKIADCTHQGCQKQIETLLEMLRDLHQDPFDPLTDLRVRFVLAQSDLFTERDTLHRYGVEWQRNEIEDFR